MTIEQVPDDAGRSIAMTFLVVLTGLCVVSLLILLFVPGAKL